MDLNSARAGRSQSCVFTTYKGQARQLLPSSSPIPSRSPPWTISAENCIIILFLSFFFSIQYSLMYVLSRSCRSWCCSCIPRKSLSVNFFCFVMPDTNRCHVCDRLREAQDSKLIPRVQGFPMGRSSILSGIQKHLLCASQPFSLFH